MGNNYAGECGAKVTMRHHTQPRLWWSRVGVELSIPNGLELYNAFTSMKLPRFLIDGAYNFAAWHPYNALGPKFYTFCGPAEWSIKECFLEMFVEQEAMAKHTDSKHMLYDVAAIYQIDYKEGDWLTKSDRRRLSYLRKGGRL